jgi:hypothetical protein
VQRDSFIRDAATTAFLRRDPPISHDAAEYGFPHHRLPPGQRPSGSSGSSGRAQLSDPLPAFAEQASHQVLVEKSCDDQRMIEKSGFLHDPIDPGFAGKVQWSQAVLAAAPEDGPRKGGQAARTSRGQKYSATPRAILLGKVNPAKPLK